MKLTKLYKGLIGLVLLTSILAVNSCESYMRNPLNDKETGESIKLLIVDFNFVTTKLAVHLKDAETNQYIDGEEVEIIFLGEDASNLITFTGTKPEQFMTENGYIELGWDPNISISADSPVELTVMATSENYISAPMAISYSSIGIKDIVIKMINTGLKSGSGGYDEPYDLKYNDVLNSDQLSFTANIRALPTGNAYDYLNLYNTQSSGNLVAENLTDPIVYSDYGVYYHNPGLTDQLVPTANPTKNVAIAGSGYSVYSSVLRTGIEKCSSGLTISINSSDGSMGSGSFNYLITYSDGSTADGIISGSFPLEVTIDNIYYPASDPATTVKVFGDSQYDMSAQVSLSNPCGATANFTATKKTNLDTYKFIIRYTCPDALAYAALTVGGEFRKEGSTGAWTRFQFIEGIAYLQLIKDETYDFRVLIDSDSYDYKLPTNPADLEDYLLDNQSDDFYTVTTLTITEGAGLVEVNADVEFTGEICDILN